MSLSDFSLFLPGSTNDKNTPVSKNSSNKNQVKVDIQKIQSNFKKLIDTIISLINDKKRLERELAELKTTSQKQKNISSTAKNSQELLKYIGACTRWNMPDAPVLCTRRATLSCFG